MQAKIQAFSLAEIFAKTHLSGVSLKLDALPHRLDALRTHDTYAALVEGKTTLPDRVALVLSQFHDPDQAHTECLVFLRMPTGLYHRVGRNFGHPDGAFTRHDKKRAKKKLAETSRNQLQDMFHLEVRATLHA